MHDELTEKLGELAHEQWSGWMRYLFGLSRHNLDGTVTIPADKVERWKRQMTTPYADLSENEKESDRIEARKVLEVISVTEYGRMKRDHQEQLERVRAELHKPMRG